MKSLPSSGDFVCIINKEHALSSSRLIYLFIYFEPLLTVVFLQGIADGSVLNFL